MTHSSISLASTDQNALGAAADEHLTDILCCRRSRLQWREHHGDALEVYVSEPCPAEPSPISGTFVCTAKVKAFLNPYGLRRRTLGMGNGPMRAYTSFGTP